jgi:hypothetical protein
MPLAIKIESIPALRAPSTSCSSESPTPHIRLLSTGTLPQRRQLKRLEQLEQLHKAESGSSFSFSFMHEAELH